jgi:hypothetical protein
VASGDSAFFAPGAACFKASRKLAPSICFAISWNAAIRSQLPTSSVLPSGSAVTTAELLTSLLSGAGRRSAVPHDPLGCRRDTKIVCLTGPDAAILGAAARLCLIVSSSILRCSGGSFSSCASSTLRSLSSLALILLPDSVSTPSRMNHSVCPSGLITGISSRCVVVLTDGPSGFFPGGACAPVETGAAHSRRTTSNRIDMAVSGGRPPVAQKA